MGMVSKGTGLTRDGSGFGAQGRESGLATGERRQSTSVRSLNERDSEPGLPGVERLAQSLPGPEP
jgi:hypothetical protein